MSTNAQKTRGRLVNLRNRAVNGVAGWDENGLSSTVVYVEEVGPAHLETLMQRINENNLCVLDHALLDNGVVIRFRRQRDANQFRRLLNGG
jgi:hypothetical protein